MELTRRPNHLSPEFVVRPGSSRFGAPFGKARPFRAVHLLALVLIASLAAVSLALAGPAGAQEVDEPLPVLEAAIASCDPVAEWAPVNDLGSLRAWDIHVNGSYRTWVAIGDGPSVEYGPGASDVRMRDVWVGDTVSPIAVQPDGDFASTDQSARVRLTDYGPDFGPGLVDLGQRFGDVEVGLGSEEEVVMLGDDFLAAADSFWSGPAAVALEVEITGPDADAFTIERFVRGNLICPVDSPECPRTEIDLPAELSFTSKEGTNADVATVVTFSPTRAGLHEASIVVTHNGWQETTTVGSLTGTGIEIASSVVSRRVQR